LFEIVESNVIRRNEVMSIYGGDGAVRRRGAYWGC